MSDDSLPAVWIADAPIQKKTVLMAMNAVLSEDRACRDKERAIRIASVPSCWHCCAPPSCGVRHTG
jgi:hypothetical protein